MKIEKASGIGKITLESFKNDTLNCFILKLFTLCFDKHVFPSSWCRSIINPTPKNSTNDQQEPTNNRGISLACVMYHEYIDHL